MAATITNEDIKVFNVSNKFGFLNISDSDDEGDKIWLKAKKNTKQMTVAGKKKAGNKPSAQANNSVVGLNTAPSQNIIDPQNTAQGLSKNAKRRARKKKQAEDAAKEPDEEPPAVDVTPAQPAQPTDDEIFQRQIDLAMKLSKAENSIQTQREDKIETVQAPTQQNGGSKPQPCKKKKKKTQQPQQKIEDEERDEEDEEEEEEDLFIPVIEDIKDVIKQISKEDDIPITDIPIDNNQLLRKRALELQEINSEFKLKLNSLLRVGYKYKRKYDKERSNNKLLAKVIARCESTKKSDMVKTILQHEETEEILTKQIEELSEELEKERTKFHTMQSDLKKGHKKISFTATEES